MNGEIGNGRSPDDVDDIDDDFDTDTESTIVMDTDDDDDDFGDITAEVNVEELVAKLEDTDADDLARKRAIRRRLEELREEREAEKDLDNTYNFNLDDDF